MKKKILLAVLVVLILIGAGFGYAYFSTDGFKTEKELFLSYFSADDMWSNFEDEKVTQYVEKQENTAFTNKGEITFNVKDESDSMEESSVTMLNNSKIELEGKTDISKKLAEQTITADFSMGFNIPVEIKVDGDTLGVQSNFLNTKFIAVRNENLKALLQKFNLDTEEMPDKIELSQEEFTKEEMQTIKDKYFTIINERLKEEYFSKEKVDNQTIITLKMPEKEVAELLITILKTVRDDEMILNKMATVYEKEELQTEIDTMIADLKETETSEENFIAVKMYVQEKDVKKYELITIEGDETEVVATIENTENSVSIKMYEDEDAIVELDISKENTESDVIYNISIKTKDDVEGDVEISLKMQYKNVSALDNVEEIYDIAMSYDGTDMSVNYKNLTIFAADLEIEGLNEDNSIVLNDATDQELQNLLLTIYQNLGLMQ